MRRLSFAIWFPIFAIVGAHWDNWKMHHGRYHQPQRYPPVRQIQQPAYIEVVEGTLAQLNMINAQWVCTNQKSGDTIVIGTENSNANTIDRRFPGPVDVRPWPENPNYNPQQQILEYKPRDPSLTEVPWTLLPGNGQSTIASVETTTADPFEKFDNIDWASYVTSTTSTASTKTPRRSSQNEFDGQGIIEPRIGA